MPLDTVALTVMALRVQADAKRVQFGGQATWGVLDDDEQLVDDGTGQPVAVRQRAVHVATGSLTGLVDGSSLTVAGVAYTVRGRPMPRENGDLVTIRLAKGDA